MYHSVFLLIFPVIFPEIYPVIFPDSLLQEVKAFLGGAAFKEFRMSMYFHR